MNLKSCFGTPWNLLFKFYQNPEEPIYQKSPATPKRPKLHRGDGWAEFCSWRDVHTHLRQFCNKTSKKYKTYCCCIFCVTTAFLCVVVQWKVFYSYYSLYIFSIGLLMFLSSPTAPTCPVHINLVLLPVSLVPVFALSCSCFHVWYGQSLYVYFLLPLVIFLLSHFAVPSVLVFSEFCFLRWSLDPGNYWPVLSCARWVSALAPPTDFVLSTWGSWKGAPWVDSK